MVEGVKRFPAKLTAEAFSKFEILVKREVGAPKAWSANGTRTFRAPCGFCGGRVCEGSRVKPSSEQVRSSRIGVPNLVWPTANRRSAEQAARTRGIVAVSCG